MQALWYRYPSLYEWGLRLLPGDSVAVFRAIARLIGPRRRVLDLGAGPGTLARYLMADCSYIGWDLNPYFAAYARRHGINVQVHDCLAWEDVPAVDCIVVSRLLHHLAPRDGELLQHCMAHARERVIVFEPTLEEEESGLYGVIYRLRRWLRLEQVLGDADGLTSHGRPRRKAELVSFLAAQGPCAFQHPENPIFAFAVWDTASGRQAG